MTQTPTNTDLAAALREIADTLPLGSQLIVRLAADRLGETVPAGDGWIVHSGGKCPVPDGIEVEVKFKDGDGGTTSAPNALMWGDCGQGTITQYRIVK